MTDLKQALTAAAEYAMKRTEIPNDMLIELGNLGILKYNPYHRPAGDERGGEFTSAKDTIQAELNKAGKIQSFEEIGVRDGHVYRFVTMEDYDAALRTRRLAPGRSADNGGTVNFSKRPIALYAGAAYLEAGMLVEVPESAFTDFVFYDNSPDLYFASNISIPLSSASRVWVYQFGTGGGIQILDVTTRFTGGKRIELGMLGIKDMGGTNATYHDAITSNLLDYFEGGGSIVAPKNAIKQACRDAFADAFTQGWLEGSGELTPDAEGIAWLNSRTAQEMGNIDGLFDTAKELRGTDFDYFSWASARADGYTSTVLSVFNEGVLMGKGNQMLEWHLGETEEHCDTCAKLDGNAHRASWYRDHDYIPRKPGAAMICNGYNCDCRLTDRNGNEVTL